MGKKVTVLSVFIPTAIAVAVIFLFRSLDRENNSMGKITNYVKRKMGECDAYFAGQKDHLEGLKADLDTRQTTAAAAVKRLEQQIEDFKQMSSGFDRHFSAVDAIGEKIASYGTVINELMDMTARVEENLDHIRKESDVIDKISASIATQKKTVDAIEKKIPQINEKFAARNEENLKLLGTELLNQYQLRAQQVDQSTRAAADRSEKMLAKLEADIRRTYEDAAKRAAQLDDAAFKRLSEQIQVRNDAFVRELGARTKELEAQMRTKIAEVSGQLRGETDAIKKQFGDTLVQAKKTASELSAEVNGNGKTLETLRASLEKQISDVQMRYDQLYEKAVADVDAKEMAKYNEFQERSARHLEYFKAKVEREINDMHNEVDTRVAAIDGEIKGKISAVQEDMNDKVAGLQGSLQTAERTKAELEEFQKQADEQIAAVSQKLEQLTGQLSTMYDTKQTELLSRVDTQLAEYRKNLEYRFGRLEQIGADVDSLEKNLRLTLEQTQGRVLNDFTAFTSAQERKQAEFARTIKMNSEDIAGQIDLLEKNLNDIKATASDNVSTSLKNFEENFNADLQRRGGKIDDELNAWKQHMEDRLDSLAGDFENDRRSIETKYGNDLKAALVGHEEQVQAKVAELSEQLRDATEAVRNQLSGSLDQAKGMADELSAEMNGNGKTLETLRASLEKQMAEIQARYDQLYEKALADADEKGSMALSQLENVASRQLESYKAAVDEKISAMQDGMGARISSVNTELTGRISAVQEDMNGKVAGLQGSLQTAERTKAELEVFQKQADEQIATVSQKLEQLTGRLSTMYDTKQTELLSLVDSQLAEYRKNLEYRFGRLEQIGLDVDSLEKNLRLTLEQTQGRVVGEFAAFTSEQERKQAEFARTVKLNSEDIAGQIELLEKNLNDIKAMASDNVSTALKDFEENFSADLQRRGGRIDDELNAWKQRMEDRLAALAGDFENDRRSIETKYGDDLKAALVGHEEQVRAKVADLAGQLRDATEAVRDQLGGSIEQAKRMADELGAEVSGNGKTLETLRASLEKQMAEIQGRYDQLYEKALADADEKGNLALSQLERVASRQLESYKAAVDEKIGAMQDGVGARISSVSTELTGKISAVQGTVNTAVSALDGEVKEKIGTMQERLDAAVGSIGEEVRDKIGTMQNDMNTAVSAVDDRVREKIGAMQERVSAAVGNISEEVRGKISAIQNDVNTAVLSLDGEFRTKITAIKDNVNATVADVSGELRQKISAVEDNVQVAVTAVDEKVKGKLSAMQDSMNGTVAVLQGSLQTAERTKADLQAFQKQADEQIAAVSQKLAQLTEKVSAVYDKKQTELLSLVEGQIAEYRNNLEYRFGKLEQIGADVDVLEKNLRQALEMTEGRVTDKFTAFTETQKQRQAEFAQSVKDNNDGIVAQIALLEENLNKIKATASDNVSATLKDFEENFTTDLRRRSSKIDDDLNAWKQNLDSKLVVLTGDFENGRRELEQKYAENIKANFSELEAKNREQTERYEADLTKSLEDIRQRVADAEQTVRSFTDQMNAGLQMATDGFDSLVKTNLEAYTQRIDDEIAKTQRETGERLAAIEQSVQDRQEAHKSNIDAMLGDFQAWRAQLKVQFDQTKELFTKQIGSLHAASNQRFEEIRNEFDQNLKEFEESAQTRQRGIVADMDGLQEKIEAALADYQTRSDQTLAEHRDMHEKIQQGIDAALADYQTRSKQTLADQQKMYEKMLQEAQRHMREQNAESEKALRELRMKIQDVTKETDKQEANITSLIQNHEAEMTMRLQNDANDLQMRFSEIDQKVKAFASQMQVYQTADALKAKLDSEISMLNSDLAKIENYQSAVQNLQAHFSQIQSLNDDMNRKLKRFDTEKNHIDSMEHKFDRLVTMSTEMDEKIRELTTTSDDLQAVQVSVRKFQETLGDISSRYDRLEKKQEVIEQISDDVDRSFENLKNLEERLGNALRQTSSIPDAIKTIQRDIDSLMASSGKVNDAVDKVTSIQNLLADTEARMQQIQAARNGIAGTETRLQNLDKQIDDKMSLLLRATQADMAKNPGPQQSRITPQDRETIIQLKRQGWTVDEIARRMKRSEGEVELILEMPSN